MAGDVAQQISHQTILGRWRGQEHADLRLIGGAVQIGDQRSLGRAPTFTGNDYGATGRMSTYGNSCAGIVGHRQGIVSADGTALTQAAAGAIGHSAGRTEPWACLPENPYKKSSSTTYGGKHAGPQSISIRPKDICASMLNHDTSAEMDGRNPDLRRNRLTDNNIRCHAGCRRAADR
ncbi:hypothetical protein [Nocardia pseudobrasiliensis]|uniref:hypothetical protein n=1 Tax=Nocardia pseudobrasiliensis TaxID=45979 RepID=UPI0014717ABE|nr:hypothetical protein [Nocardia pseudobrasiliensis]